jgi:hypothetical protein
MEVEVAPPEQPVKIIKRRPKPVFRRVEKVIDSYVRYFYGG